MAGDLGCMRFCSKRVPFFDVIRMGVQEGSKKNFEKGDSKVLIYA